MDSERIDRAFDTLSVYTFVEFNCIRLSPLELAMYHVLAEMYDNSRKRIKVDRIATILTVGYSESDGFVTISTSNINESCKCHMEFWYHTGNQSIFIDREELYDLTPNASITDEILKEERVLLYKCDIHFCDTRVHHNAVSKFIADILKDILNTLFTNWDVIFPVRSSKHDVNVHWNYMSNPYLIKECSVTNSLLSYGSSTLTESEDFAILYNIEMLYQQSLNILQSNSSLVHYSFLDFERSFGLYAGRGRFLDVRDRMFSVYSETSTSNAFGVQSIIEIGSELPFFVRVQLFMVRKPAIVTTDRRRACDSYLYRQWSHNEERVQLNMHERRMMAVITVLSPYSMKSGDETFCSKVEYGYVGSIGRYKQRNQKITHSLKRLVAIQYDDAIYKYVEERLLGKACDIEVLRRMIKLLLTEDDENRDFFSKRRKVMSYPYKCDQEALFNWNVVHNSFE